MSQQRFVGMSDAEFDALIEGHIQRSAAGSGELPPDVFVDLLLERIAAASATRRNAPRASRGFGTIAGEHDPLRDSKE